MQAPKLSFRLCTLRSTRYTLHSALCTLIAFSSCSLNEYTPGDGEYSTYTAEMVTFTLDKKTITAGEMDDDRTLMLTEAFDSDTIRKDYAAGISGNKARMMLFFNKTAETATSVSASPVSAQLSYVLPIASRDTIKGTVKTDPIILKAAWTSKNGKHKNLHIATKTGQTDNEKVLQKIGLVCDSIVVGKAQGTLSADSATVYLRFTHDQKGMPEYYTSEAFISINTQTLQKFVENKSPKAKGKKLKTQISINTYDGIKMFSD